MNQSILVIGLGNMGGALIRGLSKSEFGHEIKIRGVDAATDKLEQLKSETSIEVLSTLEGIKIHEDAVCLCVKPQDLGLVAQHLSGKIPESSLVISILAGTTLDDVAGTLAFKGPMVRAMSNIPAVVRSAATAMCCNGKCSDKQKQLAEKIFRAVGEAYWTKEALMDTVTGLSGSGPAYIYMVIEALTDGGVKMGLPRQLAASLATQTVLGSAALVKATGLHPAILKDQVTTPGGTTISAIHELEAHGLRAMLISAVVTATEHSAKLRAKKI